MSEGHVAVPQGAQVVIQVQAGIIPGEPIHHYTRRWTLTREEWTEDDGFGGFEAGAAASAYAHSLQRPDQVNWVNLEWFWL